MNIEFRKSFEKDLGSIRNLILMQRIREVIEEVEIAENISEITNIKKLKGGSSYYRIRVGDYRIGVTVDEDIVIFVRVLHRKDIYQYFP
jgi:mRNA interferase RelE/StbE